MFIVMDEDYWSTLEQTKANDLVTPFGLEFKGKNPDSLSGAFTHSGVITPKALKIPFHGARIVQGGTSFADTGRGNEPFATYVKLKGGGKIVAMGEGMVSLYMTSWEGVDGYQCQEFMQDAFRWLLTRP
jgi:hypothetical protein